MSRTYNLNAGWDIANTYTSGLQKTVTIKAVASTVYYVVTGNSTVPTATVIHSADVALGDEVDIILNAGEYLWLAGSGAVASVTVGVAPESSKSIATVSFDVANVTSGSVIAATPLEVNLIAGKYFVISKDAAFDFTFGDQGTDVSGNVHIPWFKGAYLELVLTEDSKLRITTTATDSANVVIVPAIDS